MNTDGAGNGVECRLVVNGQVIEFTLPGRLVEMAPAAEKQPKRTSKRGRK